MKILPLIFILTSLGAFADEDKFCNEDIKTRSFLSEWREGNTVFNILTSIHDLKIYRERGRIAYQDDFNGDGNIDYIFESFNSEGSAKDRTHSIYIQCKGFLKFVGGDYFAGVSGIKINNEKSKNIVFLSYQRDKSSKIIYNNEEALTKTHVWSFNQNIGRYEEEMD
ncbi:hypothetical protein [Pseudomonas sp. EA_35y_Pfl2_R111]|uniref:hypothetical protein n=1 Tax=Pseudomonas sp. EA_35y_Pfl2_R111 TaxID=3088689 RepID=UPI0030DA3471